MLIVHMYIWKIIKVILEMVVEKSWTWNWLELCPKHAVFISVYFGVAPEEPLYLISLAERDPGRSCLFALSWEELGILPPVQGGPSRKGRVCLVL